MNSDNAADFIPEKDNVFARIAGQYDFLCDIFSLYCQRYWKARMATLMARLPASLVLDAASGTGDIALRMLKKLPENHVPRQVLVTDICAEMLAIARKKIGVRTNVDYKFLDVHTLEGIADNSIDLYSISFGMKICDRHRVMAEAFRVLKPGGTFFCLEASQIPISWIHKVYLKYMDWCLPVIARIVTRGDKSAYDYLLRGVHGFPSQKALVKEIESYGFVNVSYENLTFGIVAIHQATKPKS